MCVLALYARFIVRCIVDIFELCSLKAAQTVLMDNYKVSAFASQSAVRKCCFTRMMKAVSLSPRCHVVAMTSELTGFSFAQL